MIEVYKSDIFFTKSPHFPFYTSKKSSQEILKLSTIMKLYKIQWNVTLNSSKKWRIQTFLVPMKTRISLNSQNADSIMKWKLKFNISKTNFEVSIPASQQKKMDASDMDALIKVTCFRLNCPFHCAKNWVTPNSYIYSARSIPE